MVRITKKDGHFVCKVFVAPSHVSRSIAQQMAEAMEMRLFEEAASVGVTAFLKKLVKVNGEYFGVVVVECSDPVTVNRIVRKVESRTVKAGTKIMSLVRSEIGKI